jgi:hypothetical protein
MSVRPFLFDDQPLLLISSWRDGKCLSGFPTGHNLQRAMFFPETASVVNFSSAPPYVHAPVPAKVIHWSYLPGISKI